MDQHERTRRIFEASAKAVAPWKGLKLSFPALTGLRLSTISNPMLSLPRLGVNFPQFDLGRGFGGLPALSSSFAAVANLTEPMRRFAKFMAEAGRRHRLLEASGWLPHYTTPFERLDDLDDPKEVARLLEAYYREEWPEVRQTILTHLAAYAVDDQAKTVFAQALDLHEAGFHRVVTLLVFSEIERLARAELHGGQLGGFASQPKLRELAGQLCPSQTEPAGFHGLALYQRLDDHLYNPVKTPQALEAAERDPVPNRHAAVHGLVAYDSRQNSLNALIMGDFVLQVFSELKKAEITTAAA